MIPFDEDFWALQNVHEEEEKEAARVCEQVKPELYLELVTEPVSDLVPSTIQIDEEKELLASEPSVCLSSNTTECHSE